MSYHNEPAPQTPPQGWTPENLLVGTLSPLEQWRWNGGGWELNSDYVYENPIIEVNLRATADDKFYFQNNPEQQYIGLYHRHEDGTLMIGGGELGVVHEMIPDEIIFRKIGYQDIQETRERVSDIFYKVWFESNTLSEEEILSMQTTIRDGIKQTGRNEDEPLVFYKKDRNTLESRKDLQGDKFEEICQYIFDNQIDVLLGKFQITTTDALELGEEKVIYNLRFTKSDSSHIDLEIATKVGDTFTDVLNLGQLTKIKTSTRIDPVKAREVLDTNIFDNSGYWDGTAGIAALNTGENTTRYMNALEFKIDFAKERGIYQDFPPLMLLALAADPTRDMAWRYMSSYAISVGYWGGGLGSDGVMSGVNGLEGSAFSQLAYHFGNFMGGHRNWDPNWDMEVFLKGGKVNPYELISERFNEMPYVVAQLSKTLFPVWDYKRGASNEFGKIESVTAGSYNLDLINWPTIINENASSGLSLNKLQEYLSGQTGDEENPTTPVDLKGLTEQNPKLLSKPRECVPNWCTKLQIYPTIHKSSTRFGFVKNNHPTIVSNPVAIAYVAASTFLGPLPALFLPFLRKSFSVSVKKGSILLIALA